VRDPPTGDPLPSGTALQLRVVDRRHARRRSSPHELEVEDDPDMWVPHVSEMKERKVRGNIVYTRIHRLYYACKWASYGVGRT
jgi:hypothetical protein